MCFRTNAQGSNSDNWHQDQGNCKTPKNYRLKQELHVKVKVKEEGQEPRKKAKGQGCPSLAKALRQDHGGLHDQWWSPRVMVPLMKVEVVASSRLPQVGSSIRATSRFVKH
uniref:Uncharacterized protein n=1 Tax=Solanum tuberosum TaxID=4113 RepID=M1DIR5_SOLTU